MENKKSFFTITVKAVVLNDKNEVLLLKRPKDEPYGADSWDLPGGNLEAEENIQEGLEREIKEETGIEIQVENVLLIRDFEKKYNREIDFNGNKIKVNGKGVRCIAYYKSGEVKLSKEHQEYEWSSLEKALEKFGNSDFEKDKIEALKKAQEYLKNKNAKDGWKRTAADFENYKKRQRENLKETVAYSNINLISEILPVMDNFHSSTEHIPENEKNSPWVVGIMHIQKQLEKIMKDNGVEEIRIKIGDEFNPEIMEAVENKEKKEESKNKVGKILTKDIKLIVE